MLGQLGKYFFDVFNNKAKFLLEKRNKIAIHQYKNLKSKHLKRKVRFDVYLPPSYEKPLRSYPLLFFNDGQDMKAIQLTQSLRQLYDRGEIQELVVVAIHAGNRMQEYGTERMVDYKNRGREAWAYSRFLLGELRPFLHHKYHCSETKAGDAIAGFSLGGLSAMDIAWNHSDLFGKVGVFSGSFWWRSYAVRPYAPDSDRIMQHLVRQSSKREGLQFWLQTGTLDEKSDRNYNGIIDSIDDTLDLIAELEKLGYVREKDIKYVEVKGGKHHPSTWAEVLPDFLKWGFPV